MSAAGRSAGRASRCVFISMTSILNLVPNARLAAEPLHSEKRLEGFKVLFRPSSIKKQASNVPFSAGTVQAVAAQCRWEGLKRWEGFKMGSCLPQWCNVQSLMVFQCAAGGGFAAQHQPLGEALGGLQGL